MAMWQPPLAGGTGVAAAAVRSAPEQLRARTPPPAPPQAFTRARERLFISRIRVLDAPVISKGGIMPGALQEPSSCPLPLGALDAGGRPVMARTALPQSARERAATGAVLAAMRRRGGGGDESD